MSLLDTIISNFDNRGPQIVSEQHDTSKINWVNGLTDLGEMIACGYLPQLRRIGNEADDAYMARITPLVEALPSDIQNKIRSAANRRASLDVSNGRVSVMVAGEAPWHKLGVNVREAVNSKDAARLANIEWLVEKMQLFFFDDAGERQVADGVFGIVRKDTGKMLGSVGSRYQCIQNEDGFEFLDGVLSDFGARYETAGAIHGGKKVWMQVHLPKQAFAINGVDRVEPYAIFTNSHDGSGAARCYATSQRVVCSNTFRMAQAGRKDGISIAHMGSLKGKIATAQAALGLAVKSFDNFKVTAEAMAATPICDFKAYAGDILDAVLEKTEAQLNGELTLLDQMVKVKDADYELQKKVLIKQVEARNEMLDDMMNRFDSEKNGIGGMRGTVWSAFNSATEFSNHAIKYRGSDETRESRRFESVLSGEADRISQVAYELATAKLS